MRARAAVTALLLALFAMSAPTRSFADADEDAIRAALRRQGTDAPDLVRVRKTGIPYFEYTRSDGARRGAIVVSGKVFVEGARSNRTVSLILRKARAHEQGVSPSDLIFLLDRFGSFNGQSELRQAIASQAWPPGFPPRLDWGKRRATLTLHWMPTSRRRHGEGRASILTKAVLTISATYALSWKLSTVEVDPAVLTLPD